MLLEITAKRIQMGGSFGHIRGPVDDRIALSFHGCKNPLALIEKRSVQKQISMCREFDLFGGRMLKPILDDPSNGTETVAALSRDLSHRVTLNNPALKPNTFSQMLVDSVLPEKTATACTTAKALPPFRASSMPPNSCAAAIWTTLFSSSKHHHC